VSFFQQKHDAVKHRPTITPCKHRQPRQLWSSTLDSQSTQFLSMNTGAAVSPPDALLLYGTVYQFLCLLLTV